jgi:cyanophycinase-like exopeptidase
VGELVESPQHTATRQPTEGLLPQHQPCGGGSLLLYSTSPSPRERLALTLAAQRCGRQPEAPIRVVVVQTPLAQPSLETLTSLWQHFGTQGIAIHMQDAGLAVRADAYRTDVITRLQMADLVLLTGGSPERAYRELYDTPALAALVAASQAGAVIAACSAGALLLGQGMLSNEQGELRPLRLWG